MFYRYHRNLLFVDAPVPFRDACSVTLFGGIGWKGVMIVDQSRIGAVTGLYTVLASSELIGFFGGLQACRLYRLAGMAFG